MKTSHSSHYATLGLDRRCTDTQIRNAYRLLAKQLHPDFNHGSPESKARTQSLNAAYEVLSQPERRLAYDLELEAKPKPVRRASKGTRNLTQDVYLRIEELFRGATLVVQVNDPANAGPPENYPLIIPPETAPGTRLRVPRAYGGGVVVVRVKVRPDFRFTVRGSDLRCDLRIRAQRAAQGGTESVCGASGNFLRVQIPPRVARGEIVRVAGEGLPKPRGGRGDLLVRILYTPEVRITRSSRR